MKYEGDLEMVACPPYHRRRGRWRINHWGGVQDCVDFRTISLVSHASKIVKIALKISTHIDEDCVKNAHLWTLRGPSEQEELGKLGRKLWIKIC